MRRYERRLAGHPAEHASDQQSADAAQATPGRRDPCPIDDGDVGAVNQVVLQVAMKAEIAGLVEEGDEVLVVASRGSSDA